VCRQVGNYVREGEMASPRSGQWLPSASLFGITANMSGRRSVRPFRTKVKTLHRFRGVAPDFITPTDWMGRIAFTHRSPPHSEVVGQFNFRFKNTVENKLTCS
jgi:hypothetical protein